MSGLRGLDVGVVDPAMNHLTLWVKLWPLGASELPGHLWRTNAHPAHIAAQPARASCLLEIAPGAP